MRNGSAVVVGSVAGLRRYPVKSMMGETLASAYVTLKGIAGDRGYALVDAGDGKVATAKNPRKWPTLFAFSAAYGSAPEVGNEVPPVRITLPDGATVSSEDDGIDVRLSGAVDRAVRLTARAGPAAGSATCEAYWPDMDGLNHRDTVTDFRLPPGTFFDASVLHIVTSATLAKLHDAYPRGQFDERRFRPNVIVTATTQSAGFIENDWIGRMLRIGDRTGQNNGSVRPMRDDNARSGRSTGRSGHPTDGGATELRARRRVRRGTAGRRDKRRRHRRSRRLTLRRRTLSVRVRDHVVECRDDQPNADCRKQHDCSAYNDDDEDGIHGVLQAGGPRIFRLAGFELPVGASIIILLRTAECKCGFRFDAANSRRAPAVTCGLETSSRRRWGAPPSGGTLRPANCRDE